MDLFIILYDVIIKKQQYNKPFQPLKLTCNNILFNQKTYDQYKYHNQNNIQFPKINNKLINEIKIIEPLDNRIKINGYLNMILLMMILLN